MIRLGMMLAAVMAMSIASGAAYAKVAMQTFPVPAGSGAHDVWPAPDGTVWFTAQRAGKLGRLDPKTGKSDRAGTRCGAPRRDRRTRRCRLGHRRRTERNRPGRSRNPRGEALPAP